MAARNDRNERVVGWDQESINKYKVLVIGSDVLPQMVLAGLAGLGVGNIYFIDNARIDNNSRDFLCTHDGVSIGQKKVRKIEDTLHKINQDVNILGIYSKFVEAFVFDYKPDIIIDGTNDPISKENALRYSLSYRVPFISASSDNKGSAVSCYFPKKGKIGGSVRPNLENLLMSEFEGSSQEGFTSGVISGLICEEIRKLNFKYDDGDINLPNNQKLAYNLYSDTRKGNSSGVNPPLYFKGKKALVVGAGGIGNFVALNLGLLGLGQVDILDLDSVEDNNLNRQILLYDKIGEKKANVLSDRIKSIDPHIDSSAIYAKIGQVDIARDEPWLRQIYEIDKQKWNQVPAKKRVWKDFPSFEDFVKKYYQRNENDPADVSMLNERDIAQKGYDVLFGCFDNKYARLWLNNFAINHRIPYIDGGTGPKSGQLAVYIPGETNCIDCQLDVKNHKRENMSCADVAEGSVVMSNMIIGSTMVGEAVRVMFDVGNPISSDFRYKAMNDARIYLTKPKNRAKTHNC